MINYKIKMQTGDHFENSKISTEKLKQINERFRDAGFRIYPRSSEQLERFKFSAATRQGLVLCDTAMNGRLLSYEEIMEQEQMSNEKPEVGAHLEVTWGNKSMWHECVVLPKDQIAIDRHGWHVMNWQDDFEFRPIRTERERAIEAGMKVFDSLEHQYGNIQKLGFLFDAGLLRAPEDK